MPAGTKRQPFIITCKYCAGTFIVRTTADCLYLHNSGRDGGLTMTTTDTATIERFAHFVQVTNLARLEEQYPTLRADSEYVTRNHTVRILPAKKYTKVDIGTSGRFMVVNETGEIYGIKAYGVIHRGHFYGTLANPNLPKIERECY